MAVGVTKKFIKTYLKSRKAKAAKTGSKSFEPTKGKIDQDAWKKQMQGYADEFKKTAEGIREKSTQMIVQRKRAREAKYGKKEAKRMWEERRSSKVSELKERIKKYRKMKSKDYPISERVRRFNKELGTKDPEIKTKRMLRNERVRSAIRRIRRQRERSYDDY